MNKIFYTCLLLAWTAYSMQVGQFLGAALTGRLVLPNERDRRPDGGVWFEINFHTPKLSVPDRVWLAYDGTAEFSKALLERTTRTVDFDLAKEPIEKYAKRGNILPFSLNKWKDVSPLESLAGQRPHSDEPVEVAIYPAKFSFDSKSNTVSITAEPVMITGEVVYLVKIIAPIQTDMEVSSKSSWTMQADLYHAKRFNPRTKKFDLDDRKVMFLRKQNPFLPVQMSNFSGIENSELNQFGWYIFGEPNAKGDIFMVRAVESRKVTMLRTPDQKIPVETKSCFFSSCRVSSMEDFIEDDNFRDERKKKGKVMVTQLGNNDFKVGDKGFLMHSFGGYARYDGTNRGLRLPFVGKFNAGHFSYGQFVIKTCPFTKLPRIDIEYFQVYAHTINGIISGRIKYHAYAGSTIRGWQYRTTISDSLVKLPLFTHRFSFGGVLNDTNVMDSLRLELAVMAGRYRVGDGLGATLVTPTASCVQDSNQAFFDGLAAIRRRIIDNKAAMKFIEEPRNKDSDDVKSYSQLDKFYIRFVLRFVRFSQFRSDWAPEGEKAIHADKYDTIPLIVYRPTDILKALITREFVVPRYAYDNLSVFMARRGADTLVLHTAQIGGNNTLIYPTAPGFDG